MRTHSIMTVIVLMGLFVYSTQTYALNEATHATLNEQMVNGNFNNFSLDFYLKDNLNMEAGIQESYEGYAGLLDWIPKTYKVWEWIKFGGELEDENPAPWIYARSYNHFHDPTKSLDQAGFSDWLHTSFITIPLPHSGISSIKWALSEDEQSSAPGLGDYSWPAARNYFYDALTATDPTDREHDFAKCFRSIGQLMHLVEDTSVPMHVRNEEHASGYHYEDWVVG